MLHAFFADASVYPRVGGERALCEPCDAPRELVDRLRPHERRPGGGMRTRREMAPSDDAPARVPLVTLAGGHRLWRRRAGLGGHGSGAGTIRKGRREIARVDAPTDRIRRPGAGRPRIQQGQPGIQAALEALVDPLTRGDPTSPLRWTCKSRAKLAAALTEQGWRVSSTTVGRLLHRLGYRLQSPRKRQEGATHPDRNAQFEHINRTADEHLRAGQPVISVDTKKKELVGNFKNGGREWQPKGTPPAVLVHDFPTDAEGEAIPYGVYDMARNEAWVSVGWDHDTPAFAVRDERRRGPLREGDSRLPMALAALGSRLPRTVSHGRQPASRVLHCAAAYR